MLKRVILFVGMIVLSSLVYGGDDEEKVTKVFNDYKQAILNGKGEKSYTLVDKKTKELV